jgi:CheY-like chemotaxis protein
MTKVLLVEDDKSLREIYGVRLLAEGYDIVSAGDGEAALAMAIKERPQLIVSDVMMPKISGFDMLDILRSTTETKDIKVIMMTALSSEDQRARGEALGADRYLVKSQVGIEDVVRAVHEVLGDAPVTSSSLNLNRAFGGQAPSSMPRPSAPIPQRSAATPSASQQYSTPAAPAAPQYQAPQGPIAPPQPVAAAPASPVPAPSFQTSQPRLVQQPTPSSLPQPTAPFSTTRPANLGDRIIHPLATPAGQVPKPDLGSLMDEELNRSSSEPVTPPPAPAAPQYQAPQGPIAPPQPVAPRGEPEINFEETPRQPAPQPQGPQAPSVQ